MLNASQWDSLITEFYQFYNVCRNSGAPSALLERSVRMKQTRC